MVEGRRGVQGAGAGDAREETGAEPTLVKSLLLGWFEPLMDAIEREQRLQKTAYAHHIGLLPADKMSVIVMHKMLGLLMVGQEEGCVRVVQVAVHIGEAIEQEMPNLVQRRLSDVKPALVTYGYILIDHGGKGYVVLGILMLIAAVMGFVMEMIFWKSSDQVEAANENRDQRAVSAGKYSCHLLASFIGIVLHLLCKYDRLITIWILTLIIPLGDCTYALWSKIPSPYHVYLFWRSKIFGFEE